jgi:hypothetical protein
LYLLVRSKEAKFWLFRYKRNGKIREMGLGPATGRTAVPLSAARERARDLHAVVRAGRDPLDERDAEKAKPDVDAAKAKAGAMTFAQVADMYIAAHEAAWRNPKHRQQWRNTLDQYVTPMLGEMSVAHITTSEVMRILETLWREKTQTASSLRGRIEAVLDYAKARGWREGENLARWRGHLDQLLPKPLKVQRIEHFAALPWREIGAMPRKPPGSIKAQRRHTPITWRQCGAHDGIYARGRRVPESTCEGARRLTNQQSELTGVSPVSGPVAP